MTAQAHNRFVFCVVVVEFALNGNQALTKLKEYTIQFDKQTNRIFRDYHLDYKKRIISMKIYHQGYFK